MASTARHAVALLLCGLTVGAACGSDRGGRSSITASREGELVASPTTAVDRTAAPLAKPADPQATPVATPAAAKGSDPCAPGPVKEPYKWYPELDLARIPFHVGRGEWGERAMIVAPQAPQVRRQVTVHSARELMAAAKVPGSAITIGTSIDEHVYFRGDVVDIDLIIPRGKHLRQVVVGSYKPPSRTRRVRIRGPTPVQHSGGRVGALLFYSADAQDLIIDGIDLNGDGAKGLFEIRGADRIAMVNLRGRGAGWGGLIPNTRNFVMAGSTLTTGQRTRAENGITEGWGVRAGNHAVYFRNYMEGTRFHRIRLHPRPEVQYAWVAENTFVDPYEARIFSAMPIAASSDRDSYDAVWAQCNDVYAHSKCLPPSMEAPRGAFSRITHNRFHGSFTAEHQQAMQSSMGPRHDYTSQNSYAPWKEPPAPPASPGDPQRVPLPPDDPSDDDPSLKGRGCPGPGS